MLTKAFAKFIQRKRVFCDHNACCMSYGQHVEQLPNGTVMLYCDKHNLKHNTTIERPTCQQHQ